MKIDMDTDWKLLYFTVKEDAEKMFQTLEKVKEVKERALIAPSTLPRNQAQGYADGSKAAFKRVGEMAEFALNQLTLDFGKLNGTEEGGQSHAQSVERLS